MAASAAYAVRLPLLRACMARRSLSLTMPEAYSSSTKTACWRRMAMAALQARRTISQDGSGHAARHNCKQQGWSWTPCKKRRPPAGPGGRVSGRQGRSMDAGGQAGGRAGEQTGRQVAWLMCTLSPLHQPSPVTLDGLEARRQHLPSHARRQHLPSAGTCSSGWPGSAPAPRSPCQ